MESPKSLTELFGDLDGWLRRILTPEDLNSAPLWEWAAACTDHDNILRISRGEKPILRRLLSAGASASGTTPPTPPPSGPLLRIRTIDELLAADRTIRWRIDSFLIDPTYGMIAGERKSLKSYVSHFIDIAVASGAPLFGHFPVTQAPVVAYVGEGGRIPLYESHGARRGEHGRHPRGTPDLHLVRRGVPPL